MFSKNQLKLFLKRCLSTGADFAELFIEKSNKKIYKLMSQKLDNITDKSDYGIGIRIIHKDNVLYASTNVLTIEAINKTIDNLIVNIKGNCNNKNIKLDKEEIIKSDIDNFTELDKINLLHKIDKYCRNLDKKVIQVQNTISEDISNIQIVNSENLFTNFTKKHIRLISTVFVSKNNITKSNSFSIGTSGNYKFLNNILLEEKLKTTVDKAIKKLNSKPFKGGKIPVVLSSGFGGVIMHEAVGHSLESTCVANDTSVVSDKQNQKISTSVVTLIDDATIKDKWGSYIIDDEGNKSENKILIENGILKNYMIDNYGSKKMNQRSNGCCRRETYQDIPTSRMGNTFIAPGNSTKEEMIKSINYGLYATDLGGGSVDFNTGNFNFTVRMGYVIEAGKLTDVVENITLIGNSLEVLKNIEMVGNDLELSEGVCGASSGQIPVTVGQPTIKVSEILVGGITSE